MRLPRPHSRRPGYVIALVALCLVPIFCIIALAIDGGILLTRRRQAQSAADASALAAAADLLKNYAANNGLDPSGTAARSATTTFTANRGYAWQGFTASNTALTVNISPALYKGGPNAGKALPAGTVEVYVTYKQPRYFSAIFGKGVNSVTARAVANCKGIAVADGLVLLDKTSSPALSVSGQGSITVTGAGIVVNSNANAAVSISGQGTVTAPTVDVVGGGVGQGGITGTVATQSTALADPLAGLPAPDPTTLTTRSSQILTLNGKAGTTVTLNSGVYVGGIQITGQQDVVLNPGIYYLQGGGLSVTGSGNVTGNGVMIYNAPQSNGDKISISGQGTITLSPPTSGVYKGITLYQDHSAADAGATAPIQISGQGTLNITGTLYAALANLTFSGQGNASTLGSQVIVDTMTVSGQGNVNVNWSSSGVSASHAIGLIE